MRRWWLLALALACKEFDDPSTVKDLRVLAMAAEPSEVILDGATIPEIALHALVVDPAGAGRPVAFTARACANDPRAPNAPGAGAEASGNYPAGGARSTVGSALCPPDGPTSWTLPPPAAIADGAQLTLRLSVDQLTAAFMADVFAGPSGRLHGGLDLGLPITVELTANAGSESTAAIKRVIFWRQSLRADQRANSNPVITDVRSFADRDRITLEPIGPVATIAADVPVAVTTDHPIWIQPAGAQAEPYLTTVLDRETDQAVVHEVPAETLRFQFYATAGKFVPNETASELPFGARMGARVPLEARYEPPVADTLSPDATGRRATEVRIWIVVRDERGGASWIERRLHVSAP